MGQKTEHGLARWKHKDRCCVKYCRNPRATSKKSKKCHKHTQQEYRERNPISSILNTIRTGAKRRGIECTLVLPEFREWCLANGYPAKGMHLDRKRATEGYTIDNICVLTAKDNIVKGNKERRTEEHKEHMKVRRLFVRRKASCDVVVSGEGDVVASQDCDVVARASVDVVAVPPENCPF